MIQQGPSTSPFSVDDSIHLGLILSTFYAQLLRAQVAISSMFYEQLLRT